MVLLGLFSLSSGAQASNEETIRLIMNKNWAAARENVMRSGNPVLYKFYEWSLYRENLKNLPYERIVSFINQNPLWPDKDEMMATAERNMPNNLAAADILSWFDAHPPVTGEGIERLFHSSLTLGKPVTLTINSSWPTASMDVKTQYDIMSQYGNLISQSAHQERIDRLLKLQSYTLARGLAKFLGKGFPQLVEARIALQEGRRDGEDLIYTVPKSLQNDAGLLLERIKLLRKNDNNTGAASLLDKLVLSSERPFSEDLWKERNIIVRRLIEDKNYLKAYHLASRHGTHKGTSFAEAEWLSGWLALRFLNRPDIAYQHFTQMYSKVETAISKARGAYWAGRAAESLGKKKESDIWFYQATTYPHTYYGQIALKHQKLKAPLLTPVAASATDHNAITTSDLVQISVLLHQTGYETLSTKFINAKLDTLKSDGEYQAFATYLKRLNNVSGSYRVAKRASWKNIFLGETSHPSLMNWIDDINIDPALAHAIIRQESQFDKDAESPAGALGLMQLMPATAREVAKKQGVTHNTAWLTSRPQHNILLGSAYLNELLKKFNGSYPLAIAAYNAGPSRVNGWLKAFGDPRAGDVNWIDWLELIPIAETRNYVQRVTEGIVTYRDHLGMIN
jgi:soluble lytic murein transglycosylase